MKWKGNPISICVKEISHQLFGIFVNLIFICYNVSVWFWAFLTTLLGSKNSHNIQIRKRVCNNIQIPKRNKPRTSMYTYTILFDFKSKREGEKLTLITSGKKKLKKRDP